MVRVGSELVPWFAADEAFGLVDGVFDGRRFKDLRSRNHGQSVLYGADPVLNDLDEFLGSGN